MNYYTVNRLNYDLIHYFLPKLPLDVDLVLGIPRDGILIAVLISNYRNIPFIDIDGFCEGRVYQPGSKHRKERAYSSYIRSILIVDDICATGRAMREAKARVAKLGHDVKVYAASLYAFEGMDKLGIGNQKGLLDFYGVELTRPCHYEWTQSDAVRLPSTFFDMDGVLCEDCPPEQDDDGAGYLDFLINVKQKLCPQNIGVIITWRREKYRKQTEQWLRQHGITWHHLIMAKREDWPGAAEYKAHFYKQSQCDLFIESSSRQARRIAQLSGKAVIGMDTNEIFGGVLK